MSGQPYWESAVEKQIREAQEREIVEDYNKRVLADRLRPAVGNLPPLLAKTLDVDEMVAAWRGLRDEREAQLRATREEREAAAAAARQPAPSWWSRLLGRG